MKRIINMFSVGLLSTIVCTSNAWCSENNGQHPIIPSVTRLVKLYSDAEMNLQETILQGNVEKIRQSIADNFEYRSGNNPGVPVPREEWIKTMLQHPEWMSRSITQVAAREIGDITILSFKWASKNKTSQSSNHEMFVVDVWRGGENNSLLLARYSATASSPDATFFNTPSIIKKY